MRALQFTTYGGPEVLRWADAPDPHAGPGQIRIAVRAASVNPIDWKMLAGAMSGGQPLGGTGYLGFDAAGVVDEVGQGVTGVSVGDDVLGLGSNTQAQYAVLDSWASKPSSVDWAVAAAAGVAGSFVVRVSITAGRHEPCPRSWQAEVTVPIPGTNGTPSIQPVSIYARSGCRLLGRRCCRPAETSENALTWPHPARVCITGRSSARTLLGGRKDIIEDATTLDYRPGKKD